MSVPGWISRWLGDGKTDTPHQPLPRDEARWCKKLDTAIKEALGPYPAQPGPRASKARDAEAAARAAADLLREIPVRGSGFLERAAHLYAAIERGFLLLDYPGALIDEHRDFDRFYELPMDDEAVTRQLAIPLGMARYELSRLVEEYMASTGTPHVPPPGDATRIDHAGIIAGLADDLRSRFRSDLEYQGHSWGHAKLSRAGGSGGMSVLERCLGVTRENAWIFALLITVLMTRARSEFLEFNSDEDNMGASSFAYGRNAGESVLIGLANEAV